MTRTPRHVTGTAAVGVAAIAAIALISPAAASATPQAETGNIVVEWNTYTEQALIAAGRGAGIASPNYAIVHSAVYDAVNAISGTHEPYLAAPPAHDWYSQGAAAATAAYRTLTGLLPDQLAMLEPLYAQSLAAIPEGPAKAGGISVGEQAAQAMLEAREDDGRGGPSIVAPGTEPGEWRPTPPGFATDPASWLANVTPFTITSVAAERTPAPPELTSTEYAEDFDEVKEYGAQNSTSRTTEQTDVALFWDQSPWLGIIRSIAESEDLDTAESARLFAMTTMAGADGAIDCHNDKFFYNFWRPVTAIREADTDGNPATEPDPNWTPLIETPPTPEFPSGHTYTSGAVVGALQAFFGTDRMAFSATSKSSGTTRSFTAFAQALDEAVDARVWSGIHYRTSDERGARMGLKVADHLRRHYFRPA
jgi:hypothetical protein